MKCVKLTHIVETCLYPHVSSLKLLNELQINSILGVENELLRATISVVCINGLHPSSYPTNTRGRSAAA